jgi:hypothetical protein
MMVTLTSKNGPSRLLAFRLDGQQPFPCVPSKVPVMSALSTAEADEIHAYVIDRARAAYDVSVIR